MPHDAEAATQLVVALLVGALMAAFLLPVGIGAMTGDDTSTETIDVGNTTELQGDLEATLDSVDTTADSATYTVSTNASSATATVDSGSNETVTVDGTDVTIAVTSVTSGQATADFSYPTTYGWGGGASALWTILPVILVLAVFLFFVYMALKRL